MTVNTIQGGLTPVRTLMGVYTGNGNEYEILASNGTNTFVGDAMIAQATASAADGTPNVIVWSTGAKLVLGSMRAVRPTLTNLTLQYRVLSVLTRVNVEDNPHVVFHIKTNGTLLSTDTFGNCTMVATAGSTTTGQSGHILDETSITGTGTTSLPLKILRVQPAIGAPVLAASAPVEVIIINHTYLQQATTALL